ncbi:GNAT family N-acetyltransferase [Corallococcus macrosporus]|uniref:Acetyltransferase n=1 Tax=Myxococcus fulvus (strain ATCC BAA-855 / HW-1) TaxID=483219 RepID=F8CKB8_MYXFH|nr:GNAT family N-acetyltransferase [Corallococcus macrosporus]AEI67674.1 acetyltransferase [Corallococcus macrosporus]
MPPASRAEIDESNAQYRGAWRLFALGSKAGEVVERPDVYITACNVAWSMMNAAFLRAPVETEQALAAAAASAARYFSAGRHGWSFLICDDWLAPAVRDNAPSILDWYGLKPELVVTGMVADRLQPSLHPPSPFDLRPVTDAGGRQAVADINALSYDVPRDLGREAFDEATLYNADCQGFVACRDEAPAASAVVLRVDAAAYVALVATHPQHRRQGAAEAVMRHALARARQDWGTERTVLHATEAGQPVYTRLGYRPVTRFRMYLAPPPGQG